MNVRRSLDMERLPDAGRQVRLHIGLENPADLIGDLEQGLSKIG